MVIEMGPPSNRLLMSFRLSTRAYSVYSYSYNSLQLLWFTVYSYARRPETGAEMGASEKHLITLSKTMLTDLKSICAFNVLSFYR